MEETTTNERLKSLLTPFILTAVLLVVDQVTKAVIIATVPRLEAGGPVIEVIGDFFRIIHVRNLGIAFSIGRGFSPVVRRILFILIPAAVVSVLLVYYFRSDEFTRFQRWAIAGIVAGGLGNLVDRVFRPEGVVDFLDFRFYGLFGLERWPTFNVADASVVVCGILLMIAVLVDGQHESAGNRSADNEQES
jgi:signal peptidase II